MSDGFHREALAALPALRDRHGPLFRPGVRSRLLTVLVLVAILGPAVLAVMRLDLSLARLVGGVGALGRMIGLMVPPVPNGWAQAGLDLHALEIGRAACGERV